jgi:N-acetylglucosamine kinase-like BadF-type ATPase
MDARGRSMKRYVLGIDGGGTKTQAVIVDEEGYVQGWGIGGPSNYDDVGAEKAQAGIGEAVQMARQRASLPETPFDSVFLGMAGVVSEKDRSVIRTIAQQLNLAGEQNIDIDHDCRIALAGGLSGRAGMVLIAGTGSSCYGQNAAGESWLAGGWGHLISDEGSSYWLGIQAMRCAAASHDGRLNSILKALVQDHLQLTEMRDIMHRLYVKGMSRAQVASLAPLVICAAREGDQIALSLLEQGASDLADIVNAVAVKLHFAGQFCELSLVGGLFNAGDIVFSPLNIAIQKRLTNCQIVFAELPPATGAALLALKNLGISLSSTQISNLRLPASNSAK